MGALIMNERKKKEQIFPDVEESTKAEADSIRRIADVTGKSTTAVASSLY